MQPQPAAPDWTLDWSHGRATVLALGGMLGPVEFRLPSDPHGDQDMRVVQPFAVFPWGDICDPQSGARLPPILAYGRGEWPCVPFGDGPTATTEPSSPEASANTSTITWQHPIHGAAAHGLWHRLAFDPPHSAENGAVSGIRLAYTFDAAGPVQRIERSIQGVPGVAALDCCLSVEVRRSCRLPIGLHPTLRLAPEVGSNLLLPGRFAFARSFPQAVAKDRDRLKPQQQVTDLSQLLDIADQAFDVSQLPMAAPTESLLQLCGCEGRMVLANLAENYQFELHWEATKLPSCLLWISNGGRTAWPWQGQHYALGIEPLCAYFDLGVRASCESNPIATQGFATAIALEPQQIWQVRYRMGVSAPTTTQARSAT